MPGLLNVKKIYYILRVSVSMCFIGHGAFGIVTKPIWCNYFALFGIGQTMSYRLMPILGSLDIILGILFLFKPIRAIAAWLVAWGTMTALCRPLTGEPFAEFIERAGNFGAPLCLLLLTGGIELNKRWFFSTLQPDTPVNDKSLSLVKMTLQVVVFLLLAGHGWLNILQKPALLNEYNILGFSNPMNIALLTGIFEIMAAIAVLVKPVRPMVFIFLVWKMGSELFYPHLEILEWVERGGSYGTLLALYFCLDPIRRSRNRPSYSDGISVYS
jgi:hypothetical protein